MPLIKRQGNSPTEIATNNTSPRGSIEFIKVLTNRGCNSNGRGILGDGFGTSIHRLLLHRLLHIGLNNFSFEYAHCVVGQVEVCSVLTPSHTSYIRFQGEGEHWLTAPLVSAPDYVHDVCVESLTLSQAIRFDYRHLRFECQKCF